MSTRMHRTLRCPEVTGQIPPGTGSPSARMGETARRLGVALCTALLVPRPVQTPCYHYSPAVVTLQGALLRHGSQGARHPIRLGPGARSEPPAWGDSALVLTLSPPICVAPDSVSPDTDKRVASGVRELRLAIGSDSVWAELEATRGTRLQVTGELFHGSTGRARPAVVLWVLRIAAAPGP